MLPTRLIVDPPQPGAWNMAVDEALLDAAIEQNVATLRFYQWSEPTLSLGYFQKYDDRQFHAASRDCTCVRRHSGGGAILHHAELTYSLALPADCLPSGGAEALYRLAHQSLMDLLRELAPGDADRFGLSPGIVRRAADEPFLCFQRRSDGDLVVALSDDANPAEKSDRGADAKVVGSAQRKRRGAVLQHGSILLRRSPAAPELAGLADLCVAEVDEKSLLDHWPERLARAAGLALEQAQLTDEIRSHALEIEKSRFAATDWIRRR